MARTLIALQVVATTGLAPTYGAVDQPNGNYFDNLAGDRCLHVKNASGGGLTVTIQTPATMDGEPVAELAVSVPAGQERMIGPFSKRTFNQADGSVYVDWSTGGSITAAALKVTP
jgi:hypothetical protein